MTDCEDPPFFIHYLRMKITRVCKIAGTRGRCKIGISVFQRYLAKCQRSRFGVVITGWRLIFAICVRAFPVHTKRRGRRERSTRNARNATGPSMMSSRIPSGPAAPVFRDPSSLVTCFRAEGEVRHVVRETSSRWNRTAGNNRVASFFSPMREK